MQVPGAREAGDPAVADDLLQRAVPALRMLLLSGLAAFPVLALLLPLAGLGRAGRHCAWRSVRIRARSVCGSPAGRGAVSYFCLARHGGSIEVEAAPELGATFRFTLSAGR